MVGCNEEPAGVGVQEFPTAAATGCKKDIDSLKLVSVAKRRQLTNRPSNETNQQHYHGQFNLCHRRPDNTVPLHRGSQNQSGGLAIRSTLSAQGATNAITCWTTPVVTPPGQQQQQQLSSNEPRNVAFLKRIFFSESTQCLELEGISDFLEKEFYRYIFIGSY